MKPFYSIIVTTKNNELTIRHMLKSTLLLAKNYDTELIIVDGNSVDNTYSIAKRFMEENRVHYTSLKILRDPGTSLSFARHLGFKNSAGAVLIFLDGDTPLTISFKHYLEAELEDCDLISPMFEAVVLDRATKAFNMFMNVVIQVQRGDSKVIKDASIFPPARIYKRNVLEKIGRYPVSSKFFGEDRVATALAVKLGYRYKFSRKLKLLKIDEPGYAAYWRKHYKYGLGIHKDTTKLGKQLLRGYIIARRLNHINAILPVLSLFYALIHYCYSKNFREAVDIALMKYFIDTAMLLGDLKGFLFPKSDRYS